MNHKIAVNHFIFILVLFSYFNMNAQNDAALNIEATDQGVLVPRVALSGKDDVTTIPGASISLLVYNTATTSDVQAGFYYWNADEWVQLAEKRGHYVGELWGGGIVFYVYNDGQHGLIASLDDLDGGSGAPWGLFGTNVPNCQSLTDGVTNTASIIAAGGLSGDAAGLCNEYTGGGFTDWYLPSNRELYLLASQDILLDQILDNDGDPNTNGFTQETVAPTFGRYWSSSQDDSNDAWYYYFRPGYSLNTLKGSTYRVRAVRSF
jgi:hypothetical protein